MGEFIVFKDGEPQKLEKTDSIYILGQEETPLPGKIEIKDGSILVYPMTAEEACGLALPWEVEGFGKLLLQTTRLPIDRKEPYIVNVEILRWRLMRIMQKLEDWGLIAYTDTDRVAAMYDKAKHFFIQAIQNYDSPSLASQFADNGIVYALDAGEKLANYHANIMLDARLQMGAISRKLFGVNIELEMNTDLLPTEILKHIHFVELKTSWAKLQPEENSFDFHNLDKWVDFLIKNKLAIRLGNIISFSSEDIPPWLSGAKFEDIKEYAHRYLTTVAKRYSKAIRSWVILNGIHAENPFKLTFEQILELTRICGLRAKQIIPRAQAIIGIIHPWGEYCSKSLQTIPPLLYAEAIAQNSISCDALRISMPIGCGKIDGYTRDLFQISSMIDRFMIYGLPIHIATAAPSNPPDSLCGNNVEDKGYWVSAWDEGTQAEWFSNFSHIAFSKFTVESICWLKVVDSYPLEYPYCGMIDKEGNPKPITTRLKKIQMDFERL